MAGSPQTLRDQLLAQSGHRSGVLTLLFTDVVGCSRLKRVLGEAAGVERIREHHEAVRQLLRRFPDSCEINTAGDSFFLVFARPAEAARFALCLQHQLRERAARETHPLLVRIGIHVGEVLVSQQADGRLDLLGIEVDHTAGVMQLANRDQILLTQPAREAVRTSFEIRPEDGLGEVEWKSHGLHRYKSSETPQELFEVGEKGLAAFPEPRRLPTTGAGRAGKLAFAGLVLAVLFLVFWRFSPTSVLAGPDRVISVLPLTNQVVTPGTLDLLDGLAHVLSARLTSVTNLRVITATDVLEVRPANPAEAARRFGCNLALTLTVSGPENRPRLTVALVDIPGKRQIKAETWDAGESGRVDHERLAEVVGQWFGVVPTAVTIPTASNAAYEALVKGLGARSRYDEDTAPEAAIRYFRQAVEVDPSFALAHAELTQSYLYALLLTQNTNFALLARQHADQAVALNPQLPESRRALGDVCRWTGQYDAAESQYRLALEARPDDFGSLEGLALCLADTGRPVLADELFQDALKRSPKSWELHRARGTIQARLGRWAEAEASFREVIRLVPDNHTGYRDLGGVLYSQGRLADAVPELERSIQIHRTPEALSNLGTIHFAQGDYTAAAREFEAAAALKPGRFEFWGNLGEARQWSGSSEDSVRDAFQHAIRIMKARLQFTPASASTRAWMGWYLCSVGDRDEADRELARARELAPDDPEVAFLSGLVFGSTGRMTEACGQLRKALDGGFPWTDLVSHPALKAVRADPCFADLKASFAPVEAGSVKPGAR